MKNDPIKSYQEYLKGDKKYNFPARVILELTNHCNLSCSMCPGVHQNKSQKGFMSYELFKKIIDEISLHPDVGLIPFFRGESLLHPDFIPMLEYVKSKNITPVQIATNGILFKGKIAQAILDLSIDFISFSFHGLDQTREKLDCKDAVKNIEEFIEERKISNSLLPEVQVSIVETKQTKDSIDAFVSKWRKKVERVRIYKQHSFGGNFGSTHDKEGNSSLERKPCLKPITEIAIYYNGDVAICNHDWDRGGFIGNVGASTIQDIWDNQHYCILRQEHFRGKIRKNSICAKCDHWKGYYLPGQILGQLFIKDR